VDEPVNGSLLLSAASGECSARDGARDRVRCGSELDLVVADR
jgi:hypothetical protein